MLTKMVHNMVVRSVARACLSLKVIAVSAIVNMGNERECVDAALLQRGEVTRWEIWKRLNVRLEGNEFRDTSLCANA